MFEKRSSSFKITRKSAHRALDLLALLALLAFLALLVLLVLGVLHVLRVLRLTCVTCITCITYVTCITCITEYFKSRKLLTQFDQDQGKRDHQNHSWLCVVFSWVISY